MNEQTLANTSEKELYDHVADTLIALRSSKKMTQNQLSIHSEVDRSHIAKIESKAKKPTIMMVKRLTSTLNISLSNFFSLVEKSIQEKNNSK